MLFVTRATYLTFMKHVYNLIPFRVGGVYAISPSRWNSPCRGKGGYPPRGFNQSASTRRAQRSVTAKAFRSTDLFNHNIKTSVNTDKTGLERPSLVKAPLLVEYQFAYIWLCAAAERLPRLVRRKVAMLRAFTVGF